MLKIPSIAEWQFEGLVGPTHNYAGLSFGNEASVKNAGVISNPRQAALQGLEKARFITSLGIPCAIVPPHYRPMIPLLQKVGYDTGKDVLVETLGRVSAAMLASAYSSSFMWVANTGMVAPSADSADQNWHLTPANLLTHFHRAAEAEFTTHLWQRLATNMPRARVHDPLPATALMSDEGAANHMRVSAAGHGGAGLHLFVYGSASAHVTRPKKYPARQTLESCKAIARLHRLPEDRCLFVQQHPDAIDAGVFHNDVIAMNTTRLMIVHEKAFQEGETFMTKLGRAAEGYDFAPIVISEADLPLADAVRSYLFNSQLLELPSGEFVLIAPAECQETPTAARVLEQLSGSNGPLSAVHYRDVRESMRNGGGPACLRLRCVFTAEEAAGLHQGVVLTESRYQALVAWVNTHYRDRLSLDDLRDIAFLRELNAAYLALEEIIDMPGLYAPQLVDL